MLREHDAQELTYEELTNLEKQLIDVFKSSGKSVWSVPELLQYLHFPIAYIPLREVLWHLIDEDVIERTPDRKYRLIPSR